MPLRLLVALFVATSACHATATPPDVAPAVGYLKGQLHVHTNHSGDSQTPPDEVARWYAARHYDFIVVTDHNFVTVFDHAPASLLALPGVELTQNLTDCDPPPADPALGCLLHVNALISTETTSHGLQWTPPALRTRLDAYTDAMALATKLGGIAQLNHPNYHWGADAALLGALANRGLALFEVANQGSGVANAGDAHHPSTEALWDAVLTAGGTLYGTATDDAHYYADADAARARGLDPDTADRGWVMVHAPRDPAAIRAALARGDFYASTGVTLSRIERTADALIVEADTEVDVRFIGIGGKELARSHGRRAAQPLAGLVGYVRAVVTDARGAQAWVQPIRL